MSAMTPAERSVAETLTWLRRVVVGLGLCPWAAPVLNSGGVRAVGVPLADLAERLAAELVALASSDPATLATTLIVCYDGLRDFHDFLDRVAWAEALLDAMDLQGVVQVATFHPSYRFAGAPKRDPANYSNRSPHPVFHLLRESDVTRAVDSHPDTLAVPARNEALLRERGADELEALLEGCTESPDPAAS